MNLTKILKEGDSIYSPMLGFVRVETISPSYQSYSSKELAYIARAKEDYYSTIRIK